MALTVPWDASKRERFKNRMSAAAALATQRRAPEQTYYMDPFEMTRQLIKDEFRPALPPGVSKAWAVAAYTSADAFRHDVSGADPDRRLRLAVRITHRFLTPATRDPNHELLKRAVGLATKDDFRRKRARFYEWQERIIEKKISDAKAIEKLERVLKDYNGAIENAFPKTTVPRYVFTVIPIGLGMGMVGTLIAGPIGGVVLGGTSVQLARRRFKHKPVIDGGDLDAAAMIHDARKELFLD